MTREQEIEIMARVIARSEQMPIEFCRKWVAEGFKAIDEARGGNA